MLVARKRAGGGDAFTLLIDLPADPGAELKQLGTRSWLTPDLAGLRFDFVAAPFRVRGRF
jgi:hypothetical protein